MTKAQRKLTAVLSCGGAVIVLLLAGLHFFFGASGRIYELRLPDVAEANSLTLVRRSGEEVSLSGDEARAVLVALNGDGRSTREESIQDAPVNVEDWVRVDAASRSGATFMVFLYKNRGQYWLEQPYNGKYPISEDEYSLVEKYIA